MGIPAQSDYTDEASLLYDIIEEAVSQRGPLKDEEIVAKSSTDEEEKLFTMNKDLNVEELMEDGKMILSNTISKEEAKQFLTKNDKEDK